MSNYTTLFNYQNDLLSGKTTCAQTVAHFVNEISNKQHLNAFLEVFENDALKQAQHIDKKIETKQPLGKLFGVVIGIKDNICYKGHKISAASKILENFESIYSATAVERLLAEDAIIIGRINCDEFAMGSSNENSAYGNTLNPVDETRTPGGSSGGSAVAVAAGLCHVALGSDTGGSIRQPASFCGVVGLKPTYGRVSRYGLIAFASSFDQIGPFSKSIEDAQAVLAVMAGKDDMDATSATEQIPAFKAEQTNKKTYKVAFINDVLKLDDGLQPEVKTAYNNTLAKLKENGHTVQGIDFPYLDYVIPAYYILTTAEASSNLSRYDGVHYGYRSENADNMEAVYKKSRTEGFGKEVKNRIMLGTFVLSAGYYDAYYQKAQKVRRLLKDFFNKVYAEYDFILTPTAPTTAFKLGEKTSNPVEMYLADIFTVTANLVGNPAISIPVETDNQALPIGMQFMANDFNEEKLFDISKNLLD